MEKQYIYKLGNYKVSITKVYRNRTQFEWFLNIFIGESDIEAVNLFTEVHLTKKGALNEAKRSIFLNTPRIERIK